MKFSKNWYKQKSKISKLHGYIKNCRRDFLNKLSKNCLRI
ncbi:transposase [Leptotrichia sp. oral taxon 417]